MNSDEEDRVENEENNATKMTYFYVHYVRFDFSLVKVSDFFFT